jgi:hypothetical protein
MRPDNRPARERCWSCQEPDATRGAEWMALRVQHHPQACWIAVRRLVLGLPRAAGERPRDDGPDVVNPKVQVHLHALSAGCGWPDRRQPLAKRQHRSRRPSRRCSVAAGRSRAGSGRTAPAREDCCPRRLSGPSPGRVASCKSMPAFSWAAYVSQSEPAPERFRRTSKWRRLAQQLLGADEPHELRVRARNRKGCRVADSSVAIAGAAEALGARLTPCL